MKFQARRKYYCHNTVYGSVLLIALFFMFLFLAAVPTAVAQDSEKLYEEPWDHSPITVYIDNKDVPSHYSQSYYDQVKKALEYWENGGNGDLDYTPVFELTDSETADITVRWVENLETIEDTPQGVAGYARPYVRGDRFENVEIVLEVGNYRSRTWQQYGDATMLAISKHEFGHALGLGHSTNRRDIMYPEYEKGEEVNPLLLSRYETLLHVVIFISALVLLSLGIGWERSKRKRKALEEKYLK